MHEADLEFDDNGQCDLLFPSMEPLEWMQLWDEQQQCHGSVLLGVSDTVTAAELQVVVGIMALGDGGEYSQCVLDDGELLSMEGSCSAIGASPFPGNDWLCPSRPNESLANHELKETIRLSCRLEEEEVLLDISNTLRGRGLQKEGTKIWPQCSRTKSWKAEEATRSFPRTHASSYLWV